MSVGFGCGGRFSGLRRLARSQGVIDSVQQLVEHFPWQADDVRWAPLHPGQGEAFVLKATGPRLSPPQAAGEIPVEEFGRQVPHLEQTFGGGKERG